MVNFLSSALISIMLLTDNTGPKPNADVVNYFNIPTALTFNAIDYQLSWSSHPTQYFYKQEYAAKGDDVEHFNNMLLMDFVITDLQVIDVVKVKAAELTARKKTDEICNFDLIENPQNGDYILDFVLGQRNGKSLEIVEWSAYHYKAYTDKAGHKGVLLFGMSHRAYNDQSTDFLKLLSGYRTDNRRALIAFPVPDIQLNK